MDVKPRRAVKPNEPTPRQREVLQFIRESHERHVNLKLIADHFGIHYQTALGIVGHLERKGLVRKAGFRVTR